MEIFTEVGMVSSLALLVYYFTLLRVLGSLIGFGLKALHVRV